jgi:NitT/TauT family transport system substrate-binding protein
VEGDRCEGGEDEFNFVLSLGVFVAHNRVSQPCMVNEEKIGIYMRKVIFALVCVGIVIIGWFAIHLKSEANRPINVAFNTWIGYSSFYIAEKKEMFTRRGIRVITKVIDPLAEKNAALIRGDLDAMGGTIDSAVVSADNKADGRIVWMFDRSNGTDGILVAEGINDVKDLAGKRIAVEEGFVGHFFLLYILRQNGVSPKLIHIVPMKTDDAGVAFLAGKVDAAVTWEPYLSRARERTGSKVLISSRTMPAILADTLFVSQSFLRENASKVQAMVDALQEANEYWISNRAECNQLVALRWNLSIKEVEDIMATDELYTTEDQRHQFGEPGKKGELFQYVDDCAALWFQNHIVQRKIASDDLIDSRFVHAINSRGQ